jgi:hypothetical protein
MKRIISVLFAVILSAAILSALPVFADDLSLTIEAGSVEVAEGESKASFDVWFKDVGPKGLGAIQFDVTVSGCEFADVSVGPDIPGNWMRGNLGKDTISFLWVDIETGIRKDVLAATFTVSLPEGAKAGDEIDVEIVISDDPDNYLSIDTDSSTDDYYNLNATGVNGKITVVPASSSDKKKADDTTSSVISGESGYVDLDETDPAQTDGATAEESELVSGRVDIDSDISIAVGEGSKVTDANDADTATESSGLSLGAKIAIIAGAVVVAGAVCAVAVVVSKKKTNKGE